MVCSFFFTGFLHDGLVEDLWMRGRKDCCRSEGVAAEKKRGTDTNRSARGRGGCSRESRSGVQASSCQLGLWLSPSVLGFLWALSTYWVLALCQVGAGSFP